MTDSEYNELAFYTLGLHDDYFIHQHVVDAYTVHTATYDTKAISLAFALVGLYLYIEQGFTGKEIQKFHTQMSNHKTQWPQFVLPQYNGNITIASVLKASDAEARAKMIELWCQALWQANSQNHMEIRALASHYLMLMK